MATVRLLVALSVIVLAGWGCGGRPPAPVWLDANAPAVPADKVAGLTRQETLGELVRRLGPAHEDRGSGLYVLVWRAADDRRYRASVAALEESARLLGRGVRRPLRHAGPGTKAPNPALQPTRPGQADPR